MMHKLRTAAKPVYMVVIVAFVGTIIFAWGMDLTSNQQRPPNAVGIINGREISMEMFYNSYEPKYRELLQTNNDPSETDIESLRGQTWNAILGQVLMGQQIHKMPVVI